MHLPPCIQCEVASTVVAIRFADILYHLLTLLDREREISPAEEVMGWLLTCIAFQKSGLIASISVNGFSATWKEYYL
jgi:hypothetical protein